MNGKKVWMAIILSLMLAGTVPRGGISASEIVNGLIPKTDDKVSMDFEGADLKSVLKAFSMQTGINFIASDVVENKKVTVFLSEVSAKMALASILEANGLLYELQGDNMYLIRPDGKAPVKTITKVFKLNYLQVSLMSLSSDSTAGTSNVTFIGSASAIAAPPAPASSGGAAGDSNVVSVVKSLMTSYGKIVADTRNNSLIITDSPNVFPAIEETLKRLDVEPVQIMITAEIIETSTTALKRIGLEYGGDESIFTATYTAPTLPSAVPFTDNFLKDTYGRTIFNAIPPDFKYGTLSLGSTSMVLKLLATDSDTRYLSRPNIMTLNNETAVIKVSANTAIGINETIATAPATNTQTAERAETGVVLKVTPQVNDSGDIFMRLEPSVSRAVQSQLSANFYDPSYRSSSCMLMVRDLETVVVSGLIQKNLTKTVRKVPLLGDIPIIGKAFRSDYDNVEDTEVIIFITPHIVKKRDAEYVTPAQMSEREYIMQKTLSGYIPNPQEKGESAQDRESVRACTLRKYSTNIRPVRKAGSDK